jgi:hypothetical protein
MADALLRAAARLSTSVLAGPSPAPPHAVDAGSTAWRRRAGRGPGTPETYVPGDLVRALLRAAAALGVRGREEAYGGPILLVGVLEARGLPPADAAEQRGARLGVLVQAVPLDEAGAPLRGGHAAATRPAAGGGGDAGWDEVLRFR